MPSKQEKGHKLLPEKNQNTIKRNNGNDQPN